MTRDEKGRFIKGISGNPRGRAPRQIEESYRAILIDEISPDDWRLIVRKAKQQATRGDTSARKFLADYIIGPPIERKEVTGADGGPIEVKGYVSISPDDWDKQPETNSDL